MAFVNVKIVGLIQAELYFKNIQRKTPKLGLELTERIARKIVEVAKQKVAPLDSGTGALKASIEMHKEGNGYIVTAGKGLPRGYAYYQEYGFQPHWIHKSQFGHKARGTFMRVSQFFPYMSKGWRAALKRLPGELNKTANKIVRG